MQWICALLCLGYGLLAAIDPRTVISFQSTFRYQGDPEPTDWNLRATRLGGILMSLAGAGFLIIDIIGW